MLALALVNSINATLHHLFLWAPVGFLVSVASGTTFILSGLLGIAYLGGVVARRIGGGTPGFFARSVVGFTLVALLNLTPLLNPVSAIVGSAALLLGAGGLIVTGFGRDPQWLTRMLHRRGPHRPGF